MIHVQRFEKQTNKLIQTHLRPRFTNSGVLPN